MMKKAFLLLAALALLASCQSDSSGENSDVTTGMVTFYNNSSYAVTVHQDAFSGPALLELSAGEVGKIEVRASDNYDVGTTFCIEYRYRVTDGFTDLGDEVWASGIDPNMQINFVIEVNKSYFQDIPQPTALEFSMAFMKILNVSSVSFKLNYLETSDKVTANGFSVVESSKTGVYQIESSDAGKVCSGYTVIPSGFTPVSIPEFTAQNGYIYTFTFDGSTVTPERSYQM